MKKIWILIILILTIFNSVGYTEPMATKETAKETAEEISEYAYKRKAYVLADDRSFELEDTPENAIEDIVIRNFLYTITAEFDDKSNILADIEPIKNEKELFENGIYMQSYVIHRVTTLTKEQYSQEKIGNKENALCYYGWKEIINKYKLVEYEIINVEFTQTISPKANELAPQWSNGIFSRSFIIGNKSSDSSYKIYDFRECFVKSVNE